MTSQDQHSVTGGSDTVTTDGYGGTSGGPDALTSAATTGGSSSTSTFGYDSAGNMTSRATPVNGSQTLTWTADGKLASIAGSGGTTSYIYDADGNLLLQQDPGSTTLYLPGEQLTATSSGSVTGARIIALPSGGDVVRTGATTSYYFEIPDQQGTNELELDNTAQVPTWRQFTPYGASRGSTVTWSDNRGFLNQPADTAAGLTYVGARAYDPTAAQFISPDPLLKPTDPQDLNPYDYAEDNPETNSDPTGQMLSVVTPSGNSCVGSAQYCSGVISRQKTSTSSASKSDWPWWDQNPVTAPWPVVKALGSPTCSGPGCTESEWGAAVGSVGAALHPTSSNFGKLAVLSRMYQQVAMQAPLLQNMSEPWQLPKLKESLNTRTEEYLGATRFARWGNYGFSVLGGAVAGYGEAQQHGAGKGAIFGAADTAINYGSGFGGEAAAVAATGFLGDIAAGAETGSVLGSLGGPAGTVIGAGVGVVAGAALAWGVGNFVEDGFNRIFG